MNATSRKNADLCRREISRTGERLLCSPRSDSVLRSSERAHGAACGTLPMGELGISPPERGNDPDPPYMQGDP